MIVYLFLFFQTSYAYLLGYMEIIFERLEDKLLVA